MAKVAVAPAARADFTRILEHFRQHEGSTGPRRISEIIAAIDLLRTSPHLGRPAEGGLRELVIGKGRDAFVALYRYDRKHDVILVLGVRSAREAGRR